jgi:hypothetical protein
MMRPLWLVLAVGTLAGPFVQAQIWVLPPLPSSPSKVNTDEIAKLVQQLADADFQKRNQAGQALEKLGIGALPALREAARKTDDAEVRRRLDEIIPHLEQIAALQPTTVTFNCRELPVRKAVEQLSKECGYKLELSQNGARNGNEDPEKRLVTVDFKSVPFWQALDSLCEVGGLTFQEGWYGHDQETLRLDFGESHATPMCMQGAFRISIRGFDYQRNLYFNQGFRQAGDIQDGPYHRNQSLRIEMFISVEPRLPLAGVNNQVAFTEVVDDQGQDLIKPADEYNRYYFGGGMGRSFTQPVNAMLEPSVAGKKIKIMKGTIPVTVVAAQKPKITVDKILEVKNQTYKEGNTTLTIEEVTKQGPQNIAIKLTIAEPTGKKRGDPGWSYSLQSRLTVLDTKGNKFQSYGGGWSNNGNGNLQGTFHFGPPGGQGVGEPAKMVFYEWTTVSHAVPFEFHDVPLP